MTPEPPARNVQRPGWGVAAAFGFTVLVVVLTGSLWPYAVWLVSVLAASFDHGWRS